MCSSQAVSATSPLRAQTARSANAPRSAAPASSSSPEQGHLAHAQPRRASRLWPGLPSQVLGCGTGSTMVLGATWGDSGLWADSSAASVLGAPPSVTGREDTQGGLVSAGNLRPLQRSLGAFEWGWGRFTHTPRPSQGRGS